MLPKSPVFFDWTSVIYDIFSVNTYIVPKEFIQNLPVLTEQEELDAEYVETHFEEDLKAMLDEFNRAVEEIDRQLDK